MTEEKLETTVPSVALPTQPDLDALIAATLDRQHLVAELNHATLSDLRRAVRRRRLRRWARVVAFSFGLPLMLFVCAYLLYMYVFPAFSASVYALCLIFPLLALLYGLQQAVRNFSPEQV